VQLFSDNAQKVRYFSIPNTGAPYTPAEQIAYAPTFTWSFPAGTVFVKTFELQTNLSNPNSLLRLETRLLVRDTNGAVYGVTYKWRSDYSDADLLYTNQTEPILIQTAQGDYTNEWYYPSPSDCLQCHTAVANYVLGVNARQLNASITYSNGVTDNQLRALNRAGLLYPSINESQIPNIEQLSALTNLSAPYVQRARSYLDANCAQCHQPGGPGPTFDARYDIPLTNQNIIGTPAVKGNLGYDNMDIVTPDDVWRSSIYDRMNVVNPTIQMPPLARNLIDTNALAVMAAWINSLPGTNALPPPTLAPPGGTFQGYVDVTIEPSTNGETIYYTLDGALPTTNSLLYTGPFLLTNSATVSANAWEPGYIDSVVGTAQYTILPGIFFLSSGGFTNGVFQMSFAGPVGSNYVLQVSTNLTQWTSISTNTPATTPFVLTDPRSPGGSSRFYRVLQEP
jgi:mono/diheme cytochrome c family protein